MPDVWRISKHHDLTGEGGRRASARWHRAGRPVVYLAESAPGALIEVLVHLELGPGNLPPSYTLLRVTVPEGEPLVDLRPLGEQWQRDRTVSQDAGDAWLAAGKSAFARVPSAILPHTFNLLLNPLHPRAASIAIAGTDTMNFDPRLLRARGL